jgi:NADPH:quinone reductase-like Zn-dependent oxidoreductase
VIDAVLPLDELAEAHHRMEANLNKGKIIIQVINDSEPHGEL